MVYEKEGGDTERLVRRFHMDRDSITPDGFYGIIQPFWDVRTALEKDLYLSYTGIGGADNMMCDRDGWAQFSRAFPVSVVGVTAPNEGLLLYLFSMVTASAGAK